MFERCTGPARKALQLAHREATLLNHDYLGTEHLLIGLVREGSPVIDRAVSACGRRPSDVTEALERLMTPGVSGMALDKLPLTGALKRIVEHAARWADSLRSPQVGPEHLLLAIFAEQESDAAAVLDELGIASGPVEQVVRSEAESQSQETMVHAGAPSTVAHSREVSVADLEGIVTAEPVPPSLLKPGIAAQPSLGEDLIRTEQHLRNVQLVFGALLGIFAGMQLFNARGLAVGLVAGIVLASFQDSLVGSIAFGLVGFFVGRRYDEPGSLPTLALVGVMAGAFLGSWLGNAWRPKKTGPPPATEDDGEQ